MLSDSQILNFVGHQLSNSIGGNSDSANANREKALATYLGEADGNEVEGKSSVISTDVADAIEWIMPEIVKSFTQNNEVVTFDPCYEGDEDQAELESQYVYDILMKENEGFIVLHQFIKDALLQKNGFIKVFYEPDKNTLNETYTGLKEDELNFLLSDGDVELIERSQDEYGLNDVKVSRSFDNSKINVISVPPEEFRVNRDHNSVDLSNCQFSAHVTTKTAGELIEEGFSKEFVDEIPSIDSMHEKDYRFYMQGESIIDDDAYISASLRKIEIAECYMKMDVDEDGIAEMVKVEVAGGENPTAILSIEEIDENPFISATAILMSHKLLGLSIYDRLAQIQRKKTTLWRNILDNLYLQNNQRVIAVENQVNLDDLMVSRPGGIIRVNRIDAIAPYTTQPISGDAYKMMDYLDQVRAARSGVSPEGAVNDNMIGDRVGSEGIEKMLNQKEELVGLMIRVFAETGIKPLCYMIRNQAVKHQDSIKDYKFRGSWVKINPKNWRKRATSTVRVGTGSGNRKDQLSAISAIITMQEKAMASPGQSLVTETSIFNAINDFAKFSGMPSARKYFLDPRSPEGEENKKAVDQAAQQNQQMQQQIEKANLEATTKIANAEEQKVQVTAMNAQLKAQNEMQKLELEGFKQRSLNEIAYLRQQLEEAKQLSNNEGKGQDIKFKFWDAQERHDIERERLDLQRELATNKPAEE